jgi:hypothetical protein
VSYHTRGTGQAYRGPARKVGGRGTDEHLDVAGLDDALQLPSREGGPVGVHAELYLRGRAGFEPHAAEADQLPHRPGHLGDDVAQVELDHLVAAFAGRAVPEETGEVADDGDAEVRRPGRGERGREAGPVRSLHRAARVVFLTFVYDTSSNAKVFAQSWDQALSPTAAEALLDNIAKLFQLSISPQEFATNMNQVIGK